MIFAKRKARFRNNKYESNQRGLFSFLFFLSEAYKTIEKEVSEIRFFVLYRIFCILAICNIENIKGFIFFVRTIVHYKYFNYLSSQFFAWAVKDIRIYYYNQWVCSSQSVFVWRIFQIRKVWLYTYRTRFPNQYTNSQFVSTPPSRSAIPLFSKHHQNNH